MNRRIQRFARFYLAARRYILRVVGVDYRIALRRLRQNFAVVNNHRTNYILIVALETVINFPIEKIFYLLYRTHKHLLAIYPKAKIFDVKQKSYKTQIFVVKILPAC